MYVSPVPGPNKNKMVIVYVCVFFLRELLLEFQNGRICTHFSLNLFYVRNA